MRKPLFLISAIAAAFFLVIAAPRDLLAEGQQPPPGMTVLQYIQQNGNVGAVRVFDYNFQHKEALPGMGSGSIPSSSSGGSLLNRNLGYRAPEAVPVPAPPSRSRSDDQTSMLGWVGKGAKVGSHYLGAIPWHTGWLVAKFGLGIFIAGLLTLPATLGFSSIVMAAGVIVGVLGAVAAVVGGIVGNIVGGIAGGVVGSLLGGISHLFHAL